MMWLVLLLLYTAHLEPVKGAVNRLILKDGIDGDKKNPCEGHIEVYHNNKWGNVGDTFWDNEKNGDVVCRSAHCGKHESTENHFQSSEIVWLDETECIGSESHLWDCPNPGWNVTIYRKDSVKKVKCSHQIEIDLEGYDCAGNVRYSDGVNKGYFCATNWGDKESKFLCESLNCGQPSLSDKITLKTNEKNWMEIDCQGIEEIQHLWHCVTGRQSCNAGPASVMCTGHKRLQLKGNASNVCSGKLEILDNNTWKPHHSSEPNKSCEHMNCGSNGTYDGTQLTCKDRVEVELQNNENKKCYGAVQIKVNGKPHPVCASKWTDENAKVVCRELGCGDVVSNKPRVQTTQGIMDDVKCLGKESSLWHCWAKRHPDSCSSSAYVVCAGSIKVQLADGPGKCAGRVEIEYEGKWRRVRKSAWEEAKEANSNLVCTQLECGKKKVNDDEKFSSGSGAFLESSVSCKAGYTDISQCIEDNAGNLPNTRAEEDTAAITCENHRVIFLKGRNSCSGQVGIQQGEKSFWLSGSKKIWNNESANEVCRQKRCGELDSYSFIPNDKNEKLWSESEYCTPNNTSLFACKNDSKDNDTTIASVKCKGNIKVNLTEKCWGTVNVCVGEKCGGVCKDTWTDKKSKMLCKELGCGDNLLKAIKQPGGSNVRFKSLHAPKKTTRLSQCNLVEYDEGETTCDQKAYVVCSGSVKTRINASRDKCSGDVEMRYDGEWLPVCADALKESEIQAAICHDLGCGQAVKTINYLGPKPKGNRYISKITCNGNDMAGCNITTDNKDCILSGLRCSNWQRMELKLGKGSCGGDVFVHTENKIIPVSAVGWTENEGNQLCQDLKCGSESRISAKHSSDNFWGTDFNCTNANPKNIWGCEKPTSNKKSALQLSIQCKDEPKVTLGGDCHGEVKINNISVCSSHWDIELSHLVCKERRCGKAIESTDKSSRQDAYRVDCEKYHYKLGQCNRVKERCDKIVSVYCFGNITFKTTEDCGGQIQVNYGNKLEKVCLKNVSLDLKNKLCIEMGCGGHNKSRDKKQNNKGYPKTSLDCTSTETTHIKYCLKQEQSCGLNDPTEIFCEKYKPQQTPPPPPSPPPVVPIILGVGFVLILVIVVVVFVRVYIARRANRSMKASSRMLPRQEVEFESGDYEDVTNKANEMEDFGGRFGSGFKSEAEVITENDARSTSSFPYDDIDEVAEAQPLTSKVPAAGDKGNFLHEGVLEQSSDGVTYEVDDPQENYDDIEASPEITQTQAEVHNNPQTTPGSETVAPPDFVQGDDDYLVPGEDG